MQMNYYAQELEHDKSNLKQFWKSARFPIAVEFSNVSNYIFFYYTGTQNSLVLHIIR